jgi:transposase
MRGGVITMSRRELERLEVVQRVAGRQIKQGDAACMLKLSVRQVKRLIRGYRQDGAAGLVSKRRGRPSPRRIPEQEKARFLAIVESQYADFGPTLAAEYLAQAHGFSYSVETLRGWMSEAGLWQRGQAKASRPHPPA